MIRFPLCFGPASSVSLAVGFFLWSASPLALGWTSGTHLNVRQAGGMPPQPIITSITSANQTTTITWSGFAGPYQVVVAADAANPVWQAWGYKTYFNWATVPNVGQGIVKVTGPDPHFAGARACVECHQTTHSIWVGTSHARAFGTLKNIGQDKNPSCIACHVVGYGSSTGFKSEAATPHLAGVQCENCHGPAAEHAANPDDPTIVPPKEISSKLCGGCHTGIHHPTYEEWEGSGHVNVTAVTANYFQDPVDGANRMNQCGACHSGAVRLSMLKGEPLPTGAEAAEVAINCIVCHEPHRDTVNGHRLRNPLSSTNFFSYNTGATFASQYDPQLNICAQCHNARGAKVTDSGRPPHHSPQYNMLLASIGVTASAPPPASTHASLPTQCVHCHMQAKKLDDPTYNNPSVTGHTAKAQAGEACLQCHDEPELTMAGTQEGVINRIAGVKKLLDQWGRGKADPAIRDKYGALAWEYGSAGQLSDPTGAAKGPLAAEQALIPQNIKDARFNLYLVEHDGSYGVHNARYARYLLRVAEDKVRIELAK